MSYPHLLVAAKEVETQNPGRYNVIKSVLKESIIKEKPDVKWDSVIGLDKAKQVILEAIAAAKFPNGLGGINANEGILLFGVSKIAQ